MKLSALLARCLWAAAYAATDPARYVRVVTRARGCRGVVRSAVEKAGL